MPEYRFVNCWHLTLRLACFAVFKEEGIQQLFHTTTRDKLSAQDPKRKRKKLLLKLKMSVKRCEEERTILLIKGHSESNFFEQTSASQDVSLFTN